MADTATMAGMSMYQDCLTRIEQIEGILSSNIPYMPYHHTISFKTGQGDSAHISRFWWSMQANSSAPAIGVTYTRRSAMTDGNNDQKTIYKPLSECSADIVIATLSQPGFLRFLQALIKFATGNMKNLADAHDKSAVLVRTLEESLKGD